MAEGCVPEAREWQKALGLQVESPLLHPPPLPSPYKDLFQPHSRRVIVESPGKLFSYPSIATFEVTTRIVDWPQLALYWFI